MTSGELWNELQVSLPKGMTILGVILCSNKTHLTNFSGDKSVHAVYVMLGNIMSSIQRKVSEGAWIMLAKIPTSKFPKTAFPTKIEEERMPGILQRQLLHRCMRIVLEPMRTYDRDLSLSPCMVVDADSNTHHCITILLTWIADLKQQYDIAALAPNSCPSCLVTYGDLG
ncbi:hypothetical protein BS47DRAFT_1265755, partial [Hydnum rufescens UP504]